MAAARAAHRDSDMLFLRRIGRGVPHSQHPEPPAKIALAIATRRPVVRPHRQPHRASGTLQLIGNLDAGGAGPHHQHAALRQLLRIKIVRRVELLNSRTLRGDGRDRRALKGSGGRYDPLRLNHPLGGVDTKARSPGETFGAVHLHPGTDRRIEAAGIGGKIVRNLLFADKAIRRAVREHHPRKPIVPGRAVGHQRIPAPAAPGLGNTLFLQHQVGNIQPGQMLAHGDARLPRADHQGIDLGYLFSHFSILQAQLPTRSPELTAFRLFNCDELVKYYKTID